MNKNIPDKLKCELEDVKKVYDYGKTICTHPNSFDRLQIEIVKVCDEKHISDKKLKYAVEILERMLDIINHDLKCFDTLAGLDVKQKAQEFIMENKK